MAAKYLPLGSGQAQSDANSITSANLRNPGEQDAFMPFDIGDSRQTYYDDFGYSSPDTFGLSRPPLEYTPTPSYTSQPYTPGSAATPETPGQPIYYDPAHGSRKSTYTIQGLELEAAGAKGVNDSQSPFRRNRQLWRLLRAGLIRFLISGALVGALYTVLFVYSSKPTLTRGQKHTFNFLVTAGSMMLGVNLASSFKAVAVDTRWWILSRKKRHLSEIESILSSQSQTETAVLACRELFRRPMVAFCCLLWILVNVSAQIVVAMLGLNFTVGGTIDSAAHVPGMVKFSNLTQYYFFEPGNGDSVNADQFTAHMYGDFASYFWFLEINDTANYSLPIAPFTLESEILGFNAPTYSQYVFTDSAVDAENIGLFYSNRSIVTTSECTSYEVTEGGSGGSSTITYSNDGQPQVANFSSFSPNSVIYSTEYPDPNCGARCGSLVIFENNGDSGYLYSCQVSVSIVFNTTYYEQTLSDKMAKMAAQAIAYQGYIDPGATTQEQRYPADFYLGEYLDGNVTAMEFRLRQYSIGAIMSADTFNPNVDPPIMDQIPAGASRLTLDHPDNIRGLLFGVLGGHLVIFVLGAFLANRVVVVDDSYIAIARILRPVVDKLGTQGSLLDADEICDVLHDPKMVYGPSLKREKDGGGGRTLRHLEISEKANVERKYSGWAGKYD